MCKKKMKEMNIVDVEVFEFLNYGKVRTTREISVLSKRKHSQLENTVKESDT